MKAFRKAKWWSRGWTLQELLAPSSVIFFSSTWCEIGTKSSLRHEVANTTGIKPEHYEDPRKASVAAKMSWASRRSTTRTEDIAYCLLGLFDINIPLLYGEGEKAFLRLQREIKNNVADDTIFAWKHLEPMDPITFVGIFAAHPKHFRGCGEYKPAREVTHIWEFKPGTLQVRAAMGNPVGPTSRVQDLLNRTVKRATRGYPSQQTKFISSKLCPYKQLILGCFATADENDYVFLYLLEISPQVFVRILSGELFLVESKTMLGYLRNEPKQFLQVLIETSSQAATRTYTSQRFNISRAPYGLPFRLVQQLLPYKSSPKLSNELGTVELGASEGSARLFFEVDHHRFLLLLWVTRDGPYMQVLLPSEEEPWGQLQKEFGKHPLRLRYGWAETDRFTDELEDGVHLSVSMKQGRQDGKSVMFITIAVGTRLSPSKMVVG